MISYQSSSAEADRKNDSIAIFAGQDIVTNKAVADTIHTAPAKDSTPAVQDPNWAVAGIDDPATLKGSYYITAINN